ISAAGAGIIIAPAGKSCREFRRWEMILRRAVESLNARILGAGRETLVLSHGFGCDQSSWQHLSPWLTQHYRVAVYDLACAGSAAVDAFDMRRHRQLDGYVEDL